MLALVALLFASNQAAAAQLTGPMAKFASLPGKWTCASHISGPGMSPQNITMLMNFDAVRGNVLHDHLFADGFDAHLYYGYSKKHRTYWAVTANSDGTQLQQKSQNGLYFAGAIVQDSKIRISDLFLFEDSSHFHVHDITTLRNNGQITTDSQCVRIGGSRS